MILSINAMSCRFFVIFKQQIPSQHHSDAMKGFALVFCLRSTILLVELEVVASVVVRDILYHAREALHVVRQQALLYIVAKQVAKQTTEILVTWVAEE